MNKIFALLPLLAALILFSCKKDPAPPIQTDPAFRITLNNEFSTLTARFAVFLSDIDGKVLAYRELPGSDTAQVELPNAQTGDRYDCTVVKIVTIDAPGSGVKDTLINLTTYTNLASGETINLRDLIYQQSTDLNITFTGVTSVDTIIVPDGLTFVRPQQSNNFSGLYRVLHTGKLWLRVKVNGEPGWRFIIFENVSGPTLNVTLDASLLLPIMAAPVHLTLPFSAAWQYKVDGLVDTAALKFLALGDLLRAPGGAVPFFGEIDIFQPIFNDANPGPMSYKGFRLQVIGEDISSGGYSYFGDFFYANLPTTLPIPVFDLLPTVLADNRLVATHCVGQFDVLAFARTRAGTPNINWEVYITPSNGIVTYRLPDVPTALGAQFPSLKNYDFGGQVRARAEQYERLDYGAAIHQRLQNNDPLWKAKGGYLGREEVQ